MKALLALAFIVMSLTMGVVITACSDDASDDAYENEVHRGYPGPGVTTPNRDQ